ncbi:MAG: aminopeptidase, partial [Acetatifactor sp.]|nr:aminopeptidase [Acetatifactor sp.]
MEKELLQERFQLAFERIHEMKAEHFGEPAFELYFAKMAEFALMIEDTMTFLKQGGLQSASLQELKERNHALYADVMPKNYDTSYGNPAYAVKMLGEKYGAMLSNLYTKMYSMIGYAYEDKPEGVLIYAELLVEVYSTFVCEWEENKQLPDADTIQQILYWFSSDYAELFVEESIRELVVTEDNFAAKIIMNSDFSDLRYLFAYGECISENELKMAEFMAKLPQETINTMADTYTEGYRIGFEVGNKDLSKKSTAGMIYPIGFERMMKRAIENFAKLNLKPAIYRNQFPSMRMTGFFTTAVNRQFAFDHKDDRALVWDKKYVNRQLEVRHAAFEKYKEEARGYAGPAVVETFGEANFEPVNKPENYKLSDEQNRLWVEFMSQAGEQQRQYILEDERSFTIIAFPIPEIGENFEEIFEEIIRINTLDYTLYQRIQQTIIDTLNTAKYCIVKGNNGNHTDLTVQLYPLKDPEKETIFENCVADVNIPVGEVFTSPVLKGTTGVLHVSKVYLNGLEYKDLEVIFEDGMIRDYNCKNFKTEEENKAFIKENVLYRHDTLPIGEFAIGTNTTAYVASRKYDIGEKLPILIAEKTGPHFAVGDT